MKNLLVVDDHPIVLEGIHSVLARKGFKVLKATTAEQAMSLAEHVENIDIFVIDLSLADGNDGLTLVEDMRSHGLTKPVIIYTMHEELWNISSLMQANVEGIVLKGDNINELVHAVQIVAKGETYRSPTFDKKRREVMQTNGILSTKDIEVLRRLSDGEANRDIARAMDISEKTVEYHRGNILRKLCSKTMLEATRRAIALGIIYSLTAIAALASSAGIAADTRPQPVDLGLSVLWADRNLGAESIGEPGGFYAFGETFTKDVYGWKTYTHCDGAMESCHDLGTEDISGTEYDAAHVILGDGWRLPTAEEFLELIESTTSRIETIGGLKSARLTAANGESISLPFFGYMSEGRLIYEGRNGTYHTSACEFKEEKLPIFGNISLLTSLYVGLNNDTILPPLYGSVHLGMNIRPVKKRPASAIVTPSVSDSQLTVTAIYGPDGRRLHTDLKEIESGFYIIVYSDGSKRKIIKR